MRREPLPIAGDSFDDDLLAGVGQPIEGAIADEGVVEYAEQFLIGSVVAQPSLRCPELGPAVSVRMPLFQPLQDGCRSDFSAEIE